MLTLRPVVLAALVFNTNTAPTETRYLGAVEGTWDAHFRPTLVQLNLHIEKRNVNFSRAYTVDELRELRRERRAVGFELRRSAGSFRFDGVTRDLRASGTFEFTPNNKFKRSVENLGLRGVDRNRLLTLALHNITLDDIRVLQRTVYGKLTTPDLVRMLDNGVNTHYVRDLAGVGFGRLTPQLLINLRERGVDADYIRGLRAVGLADLTLANYMELREHDVTPEYAQGFIQLGYDCLDLTDLMRLRDAGITAVYAQDANKKAGELLSVHELIRHRADGDF
jgi:hypothetical protein